MLKKSGIPEWVFGILFVILIFLMGFVIGSSPHPSEIAEQQGAKKTYDTSDYYYSYYLIRDWFAKDAAGFFTALLFVVGFGQAALFLVQLRIMRKGMTDAEIAAFAARDAVTAQTREFLATHRPRIRIKHVHLNNDIWEGMPLVVTVLCVNTGTTEAIIREFGTKVFVLQEKRGIPFPDHGIPPFFKDASIGVDCGSIYRMPNVFDGTVLSGADHVAIREGRKRLFCAGYVHYVDKDGRRRTTGFSRMLTLPDGAHVDDRGRFRPVDDPDLEYED